MAPLFIPQTSTSCCSNKLPQEHCFNAHKKSKGNLRKYVVLAHDIIAVKIVSKDKHLQTGPHHHQDQLNNPQDHGTALFKLFITSNLSCHWNTPLQSSLSSLNYHGYIHPSTILLSSPQPHNLNTLRTAWSRRVLQEPPGYTIEFLGEVEEIFTQPVSQSQFAPLSDSLCWAIMKLTASNTPAFADQIYETLKASFPGMEQPPRELVYHTLEKLIKQKIIYQTPDGYFINQCCNNEMELIDRMSQVSWGSMGSVLEDTPSYNTLKRHNSLRVVSKRDELLPRPHMGARSLSFRMSKRHSILDEPTTTSPEHVLIDTQDQSTQVEHRKDTKKRRSLFSRLFSFTRKSEAPAPTTHKPSISTQTLNHPPLPSSSSTLNHQHRRASLLHIEHHQPPPPQYDMFIRSQSRSSIHGLYHHRRSLTRASSPACSNTSNNIYASLRCTPTAYNSGDHYYFNTSSSTRQSRTRSRTSIHDLYRHHQSSDNPQITVKQINQTIESSGDDVSH